MKKFQKKLGKIKVVSQSFEDFIPSVDDTGSFLYVDPPYYGTENLYAFHNFTKEKHEELADMLNTCRSRWILSYYEFPEMKKWYPEDKYEWVKKDYKKASMASSDKKQTVGTELLIIKK